MINRQDVVTRKNKITPIPTAMPAIVRVSRGEVWGWLEVGVGGEELEELIRIVDVAGSVVFAVLVVLGESVAFGKLAVSVVFGECVVFGERVLFGE